MCNEDFADRAPAVAGACPGPEPRRIIARSRFVHRQTISVLLRQSGQPTHPRSCLPLLPSLGGRRTILRRNKFAFQPTSLVLGRAAASVHLRRKSPCEKPPLLAKPPSRISRSEVSVGRQFGASKVDDRCRSRDNSSSFIVKFRRVAVISNLTSSLTSLTSN